MCVSSCVPFTASLFLAPAGYGRQPIEMVLSRFPRHGLFVMGFPRWTAVLCMNLFIESDLDRAALRGHPHIPFLKSTGTKHCLKKSLLCAVTARGIDQKLHGVITVFLFCSLIHNC